MYMKGIKQGGRKMDNATKEGYKKMLEALKEYTESVNDNEKVLLNAANVCCEAMGNDKISTESKEKLEEILTRVNRLYPMVEDLVTQISQEYKEAFEI